ncbi:MAG: hypothetical protein ABJB86_15675 [Bacteroidota bacterium]
MKSLSYISLLTIITLTSFKLKESTATVKDYFNLSNPVEFNKINYSLSWSAHPAENYYKQEYLSGNEKSESFNKMVMIEAAIGNISLPDAVKAKINELEQRKKNDPLANYQVIKNQKNGEYILDFIMGQSTGGKTSVAEWNAYRYMPLVNIAGKTGILLFAYSKRAYGTSIPNFLTSLKKERLNDINILLVYKMPAIRMTGN